MSAADKRVCVGTKVTAYWSIRTDNGQLSSLVGRQWEYGKFDCYTLMRDWFELQGIELPILLGLTT